MDWILAVTARQERAAGRKVGVLSITVGVSSRRRRIQLLPTSEHDWRVVRKSEVI